MYNFASPTIYAMSFVHLHVHTQYSILDGFSSISKLFDRADELGMPALAITDHGNMYGIKCFWWDDGGNYKLFDRKSMSWRYPQIVNGMMQAAALVR